MKQLSVYLAGGMGKFGKEEFEKAFEDENNNSVKKTSDFVSTSSVSFKDNYYQPRPNPALPVGKEAEVHNFVAEIVSSRYAHAQDTSHHSLLTQQPHRLCL